MFRILTKKQHSNHT